MEFVSLEVKDHIGIVTVDKPPLNTINRQAYEEIIEAFDMINSDDDVYAAILTAKGKAFMAGNDVSDFAGPLDIFHRYVKVVNEGIAAPYNCRVPVIGAINGLALGTGTAIAATCDILVASEDAYFGITEINFSMVSGPCHFSRLLPELALRDACMRGKKITARELQHYGAIAEVVPKEEVMNTAMKIAGELLGKAPLALIELKRAMNETEKFRIMEKYEREMMVHTRRLMQTKDLKESVMAFFEKRKPNFSRR